MSPITSPQGQGREANLGKRETAPRDTEATPSGALEFEASPREGLDVVEAKALGVRYALVGQVRQALAERANAVAHGLVERIKAADKALDELDYRGDRTLGAKGMPVGRSARSDKDVRTDAPTAPAKSTASPVTKPDTGK
jgi:hypothetical protein